MTARLAQAGIYVITDAQLTPSERLLPAVAAALRGGAGMVQYRDKGDPHLERQRRAREARALLELCRDYAVPLIINDDIELAADINADGVHLGRDDAQPTQARQRLGEDAIIGVSGYADPAAVETPEADYIAFGRLFDSPTKPQATPASLGVLRKARQLSDKPLVGIGGITADNAPLVCNAGAHWLAVVSSVFAASDIEQATQQLSHLITQQI